MNIQNLVRTHYDAQAEDYQSKYENEVFEKPYDRAFLDRLAALVPQGGRVLDVGCASSCQQARYLATFFDVTAIDLSCENVRIARAKFPHLDVREMDMLSLRFDECEFDAINAFYSIIHIPSALVSQLLFEFSRVLKKDGKLSIAVHKGEFEGVVESERVYFTNFSQAFLVSKLELSGFKVLSVEERPQLYDFEYPSERIYILAEKSV